jgi:hypothetical protein
MASSPAIDIFTQHTSSPETRANTVLVLSGTGVNMWQYYRLLCRFSLDALSDFSHIYGISGGAVCAWFRVLEQMGIFDAASIASYEPLLRTLNRQILPRRVWNLCTNTYVYESTDLANGVERFASREARTMTFGQFPLRNFTAIAFDSRANMPFHLTPDAVPPSLPMADAMAALSSPGTIAGRRFCRPLEIDAFLLSDFDFAPRPLRRSFKSQLLEKHRHQHVLWINVYFSATKGNVTYVKVNKDRYPRLGQLWDGAALFLGLPNRRISSTSTDR